MATNQALNAVTAQANKAVRKKRSISLYGHRTSVALETPFWEILDAQAAAKNISLAALICALDDARITAKSSLGLAAYLRVWALLEQS
jgi:predicted DNA-binding ribbon-helix-helix protein